jgi:hypothetical protein
MGDAMGDALGKAIGSDATALVMSGGFACGAPVTSNAGRETVAAGTARNTPTEILKHGGTEYLQPDTIPDLHEGMSGS